MTRTRPCCWPVRQKLPLLAVFALLSLAGCNNFASAQQGGAWPTAAAKPLSPAGAAKDWVADEAHILEEAAEAQMTAQLQKLERQSGHQLLVRTVVSLNKQSIENYSLCLADRLGIGRKDYDDGALILVAPNERQARIELGYGLESDIPDERAKIIMDAHMLPLFREGNYEAAVEAGVREMVAIMEKIPYDTRAKAAAARKSRSDSSSLATEVPPC